MQTVDYVVPSDNLLRSIPDFQYLDLVAGMPKFRDRIKRTQGSLRDDALPAAWYLARNFTGVRLAELGSVAGDVAYSAVSMAIIRFEKRLAVDRDLQRRIKDVRAILQL